MNERARINIISFDSLLDGIADSDGTYDSKLSSCSCHRRLVLHPTKQKSLMCPGCGTEVKIKTQEEASRDKLKTKHSKKKDSNNKKIISKQL